MAIINTGKSTGKAQAVASLSVSPSPSAKCTDSSNVLTISLEEEREVVGIEMQCHTEKKPTGETPENAVSFSPQRQTRGGSTLSPPQLNRWLQGL